MGENKMYIYYLNKIAGGKLWYILHPMAYMTSDVKWQCAD